MKTVVQLNVTLPNQPGSLALMSDRLRAADVNIEALFCEEKGRESIVHVIVDDVETAKIVLKQVDHVTTTDVLSIKVKNSPGAIAQIARMCAGANINILHIYATSLGKEAMMYLAVDDLEKAKKVLK